MGNTEKFVAIDFEHLTQNHETACSVGMVKVINSVIVQEFYSLIKPAPDERTTLNTHVHGITEEMCADAPTFEELLPFMEQFTAGCLLVAHHHGTEKYVLEKACRYYGHTDSPLYEPSFIDTFRYTDKGLQDSCKQLGIELKEHHNALEDARACAELYIKLQGREPIKPKPNAFSALGYEKRNPDLYELLPDEELERTDTPFYHKHIITSGQFKAFPNRRNDLLRKLQLLGAINLKGVTKATEWAILGDEAGGSKMKKLADMENVRYIYEEELMSMLKSIDSI